VAETWDGDLNHANGFHLQPEDAFHALDSAHDGPVEEGNVGGGTGMICNEFKGGIGTASRVLDAKYGGYTVGVLVQCNYGWRSQLRIAGIPVGREISEHKVRDNDVGSIIVVVATDAPLIPTQLKRVAKRVSLGLARDGSFLATARETFLSRSRPPTRRRRIQRACGNFRCCLTISTTHFPGQRTSYGRGGDECHGRSGNHGRNQ
jgi:L-aminopeptidase/D-esterase-like protein